MAAEGLSNREIGQRLYISHRTIAYHLRRIFRSSVSPLAVSFTRPCSVWRRDGVEPLAIRVRPDALRRSVDDIPVAVRFLFDTESFSFETLRTAGFAAYGGAELVLAPVVDYALTRGEIAADKVVLFG